MLLYFFIYSIFICICPYYAAMQHDGRSGDNTTNTRQLDVGQSHFQKAISLIQQGNIEEAIGYLRAAHRANPENVIYLTNLGVAEMNKGEFEKSYKIFQKALRLESSFQAAIDNFEILKKLLKERDLDYNEWHLDEERTQKHTLEDLKRIHINDLYTDENADFHQGYKPFILEGAMDNWNLQQFSLHNLKLKYSNQTVNYYPQNMKHRNVGQYFRNLSFAIEELENPTEIYHEVDASEEGAYILFNLPKDIWDEMMPSQSCSSQLPSVFKTDDEWLDKCFHNNEEMQTRFLLLTHWRMLIIGERNSGMFHHKDSLPSASFHAQISGTKRWHLCPPTLKNTPYMYQAGDVDWFHPNYITHPLALHAECYQVDLKPREIIFYPKHYWHQTLNLEKATVSLTGTLVNQNNWRDMMKKFSQDCQEKEEWSQVCLYLQRCFLLWEETWPYEGKETCSAN